MLSKVPSAHVAEEKGLGGPGLGECVANTSPVALPQEGPGITHCL